MTEENVPEEATPSVKKPDEANGPSRKSGFMFSPSKQVSRPPLPPAMPPVGGGASGPTPPPPPPPEAPRQLSVKDMTRDASGASAPPPPPPPSGEYYPPYMADPAATPPGYDEGAAAYGVPPADQGYYPAAEIPGDEDLPPPVDNIPTQALIATSSIAIVGAVTWATLIYTAGIELGWLAWGIGVGVGFTANYLRGRGIYMGLIAGGLAFLAIFGGRFMGIHAAKDDLIRDNISFLTIFMTAEAYSTEIADAAMYSEVENDGDLRQFLWESGRVWTANEWEITDADLDEFRQSGEGDYLLALHEKQPNYAEWKEFAIGYFATQIARETSSLAYFIASFGVLDVIFIFLGVGSAFWWASRRDGAL